MPFYLEAQTKSINIYVIINVIAGVTYPLPKGKSLHQLKSVHFQRNALASAAIN